MTDTPGTSREADDIISALALHRELFLTTAKDLSDDQARMRSSVSELTIGGLIKHVSATERGWLSFAKGETTGAGTDLDWSSVDWEDPSPEALEAIQSREREFTLLPDETLAQVVAEFVATAEATAAFLRDCDLNLERPLPEAPWFEPGTQWSTRRVALHLLAEMTQHAGHADIIREGIDGAKTMG